MNENYFKSKLSLQLKNPAIEKEFTDRIQKDLLVYGKYFIIVLLLSSILDIIFQITHLNEANGYLWAHTTFVCSIITMGVSSALLIIVFIFKGKFAQKCFCYLAYLFFTFPFLHGIILIPYLNKTQIFPLIIFGGLICIRCLFLLFLTPYPDCIYICLAHLIIACTYNPIIENSIGISLSLFEIIFSLFICYLHSKRLKFYIFSNFINEERLGWYGNIFEHLNSGFISFNNNKINIMNKCLIEYLARNKIIGDLLERNELFLDNTRNKKLTINENELINTNLIDENIIKSNSEKVLRILFSNINEKYSAMNYQKNEQDFNLNTFVNRLRTSYLNEKINNKFQYIGYKDLEIETITCLICTNTHTCPTCNTWDNLENKNKQRKKIELRRFEIFFRCHAKGNSKESEEIEVIFNDITKIKNIEEEKSADLNYKTLLLSKVAHEFKNPLLCISELVNEIQDNYNLNLNDTYSNNNQNMDSLRQLQSMSEYLLLLIKDLDYFSHLQIKKTDPELEISECDLDETIGFTTRIAEILIAKFNKIQVKFSVENSVNLIVKLKTDCVKLKQIIINLISNAIKFTNEGFVKLIISQDVNNNLEFEVKDTGVGLAQEKISNLNNPFNKGTNTENLYGTGLGLYIVTQMLKQLNSKLEVKCTIDGGTSFSFTLDYINLHLSYNDIELSSINITRVYDHSIDIKTPEINNLRNKLSPIIPLIRSLSKHSSLSSHTSVISLPKVNGTYIVVDDEKYTRMSTVRILKRNAEKLNLNIVIIEAEDGMECLYHAYTSLKKRIKINGIISDEMMIHINGSKAAEIFRQIKNLNTEVIPFYILTAYPDFSSKHVDHVLSKPLSDNIAVKFLNDYSSEVKMI